MLQSPTKNPEEPKMRTEWTARAVIDEAWIMDALTGSEITYEDREVALAGYGLVVEFNG